MIIMNDYVELEYDDLHVDFSYGPMDWETGLGKKDFSRNIYYTYRVDKNRVEEEIADLLPENEIEEIVLGKPDESTAIYDYIDLHFDELFDRYEKELLEIFRRNAEREALEDESIIPESYNKFKKDKKTLQENNLMDNWGTDLQSKFEFLREHKTYDSKFSRDCKVWDLGLTDKEYDYFYEFMGSGALELFWKSNKELAKDIYQEGRMGGHLVFGDGDSYNEPIYYDSDVFKYSTLDECFENWYYIEYNIYPEVVEDEAELEEARKEFAEWLEEAYDAVVDFDERAEELIDLLKKDIDSYIETVEADDPDITSTVADELDEMVDPELERVGYEDEINESYFDVSSLDKIEVIEDDDEEDDGLSGAFIDAEGNYWVDGEKVWQDVNFDSDDDEDFDECINNARDELPELEEAIDFNPDYDDDFADRVTSYDIYKASRDLDSSDEEALEDRDPNRYDEAHAEEWMKKHPSGWYNSESDYGVGDEDEDLNEAIHFQDEFDFYSLRNLYNEQVAYTYDMDEAIKYAEEENDDIHKIVHVRPNPKDNKVIWTKLGGSTEENLNEAVMSDLALEIQSNNDIISKLEYDIDKLEEERNFLKNQAPREINKGGAFDSQEEIDDALKATERALSNARLKLKIIRGTK